MKDPERVQRGRKNKRRGSNFESRVRAYLRKYGFYVQRNTFGLYDIIALPPKDVTFSNEIPFPLASHYHAGIPMRLQPTTQKYVQKDKIKALKENENKWIGIGYLVQINYDDPKHSLQFTKVAEL